MGFLLESFFELFFFGKRMGGSCRLVIRFWNYFFSGKRMGSQWAVAGGRWVVVRFSNYFFSTKRMGTAEGWYSFLELIFFEERMGGRLKVGRLVFVLELTFFEERMGGRLKVEK